MLNFRLKLRILWISTLLVLIFVLFWLKVVPGGKIVYVKEYGRYDDFISNLTPVDRISGNKIIGDPAYFSLRVPRRFEKVEMTVRFKNDSARPIIEAGVLMDKKVWNYDLKPLDNSIIDDLSKKWSVSRSGDLLLLQRDKNFDSVEDFLKNMPNSEKIASYNYSPKTKFVLPDYRPSKEERTSCRPIQGAYQFYTYIKDEDLSFDFSFHDLNKNDDVDDVDLIVYRNDKEIHQETLKDDGGDDRRSKIFLAGLPEGVYKVSLRANNDIVTRSVKTLQSKIVFINKVALADAPEVSCGRNLFTDSRALQFQTVLSDRIGEIKIHQAFGEAFSEIVGIEEAYKQFSTKKILPKLSEVAMPFDGVTVSGDGLFSFSEDGFFDPEIKKVGANFDVDREGVDYVIARYVPPTQDGDWKVATVDFDLTLAYKENGKHSFLISIPGLKAEDGDGLGVEVGDIKVDLEGVSLWKKIKKIISSK